MKSKQRKILKIRAEINKVDKRNATKKNSQNRFFQKFKYSLDKQPKRKSVCAQEKEYKLLILRMKGRRCRLCRH